MQLEALQARFSAAMLDPQRERLLMPTLAGRDPRTADRIALYRGNMVAAWQKALSNAFPVVRALVGDEFFDALARVYGHAHPGDSGDLNRFGAGFAGFVADFEHTQSLPYLPDVAALEWTVHRAHYAADAVVVSHYRIAPLLPRQLLAMRFGLNPACAWLSSNFPIADIWLAHQPDADCPLPESLDRAEIALVVRPAWRVEVVASTAGEIAALDAIRNGASVEEAIAAAQGVQPSFDFARALPRWLERSLLTGPPASRPAAIPLHEPDDCRVQPSARHPENHA